MNNIKRYLFISDNIRTLEAKTRKNRETYKFQIKSRDCRKFFIKLMSFYLASFLLIPFFKMLELESALFLEHKGLFILGWFTFLDFIFIKYILKKNKNRKNFTMYSLILFAISILFLLISSNPNFVLNFNAFFRLFSFLIFFNFAEYAFVEFFVYGKKNAKKKILESAKEMRSSKNQLRKIKKEKDNLIQVMSRNKDDMKYILELHKGTLDFEHELISSDPNKKIKKENFNDVVDCFIKNSEDKNKKSGYLERLFNEEFEDVNIINQ
jgi:hypothetical protein